MDTSDRQGAGFLDHFAELEDPRINRKKLYPLPEVLFIALSAVICGAESWRDMVDFGHAKRSSLSRYLALENGIPSKSTFARVFSLLNPDHFQDCFTRWVAAWSEVVNDVIAIDGKTLRRSFDRASQHSPIHMVSAFASDARLVLAQQKVDEKSNEITAIPELLKMLSLQGTTVTIDAMGCQKAIAEQLVDQGANYVLALKGNHGDLHDDVTTWLDAESAKPLEQSACDYEEQVDAGHGRVEVRRAWVSDQLDWLPNRNRWKGLHTLCLVESERHLSEGKVTRERRYYLSTLPADARLHIATTRAHWGIENGLHWVLDMSFREDESRIRDRQAAETMAMVRHMALNLLQSAKKTFKDMSIKRLRKKAGWDDATLDLILSQRQAVI